MPLGPSWMKPMPSHKTTKKKPASFDIPIEEYDESAPFTMDPKKESYHPIDLEEGIIEKLIKLAARKGGNYISRDGIYLEQYLHPEQDIIPKQPLRPANVKDMPDMEFRRVPERAPIEGTNYRLPNDEGLGHYTKSRGKDYDSIYDIWDFNTESPLIGDPDEPSMLSKAGNWVAKKVMQNVGTPYAVYERYPKDEDLPEATEDENLWDENNEYIPLKKKGYK